MVLVGVPHQPLHHGIVVLLPAPGSAAPLATAAAPLHRPALRDRAMDPEPSRGGSDLRLRAPDDRIGERDRSREGSAERGGERGGDGGGEGGDMGYRSHLRRDRIDRAQAL